MGRELGKGEARASALRPATRARASAAPIPRPLLRPILDAAPFGRSILSCASASPRASTVRAVPLESAELCALERVDVERLHEGPEVAELEVDGFVQQRQ